MVGAEAVLFVVDGMRPDGLQQACTPVMDRLMGSGVYTLGARTVMPSATLPCLTSLFLSAQPAHHGITTNTWAPTAGNGIGLMEVLHQSGRRAVSFYNWEEVRDVSRPGSLAAAFYPCGWEHEAGDRTVALVAADWLRANEVDFAFVYLGYTDAAGHAYGWMSDAYLRAISSADACIGEVLEALPAEVHVAITSDHGGHRHTHGTDCDEDMTVPLILAGPGVPAGRMLTGPVSIVDVAPTVAHLLRVEPPATWTGTTIWPA